MAGADNDTMTCGMKQLVDLRSRLARLDPARTDLQKLEEEVRAALDEVGRELMATAFAAADIDDQEILVNGVLHGKGSATPGPPRVRACASPCSSLSNAVPGHPRVRPGQARRAATARIAWSRRAERALRRGARMKTLHPLLRSLLPLVLVPALAACPAATGPGGDPSAGDDASSALDPAGDDASGALDPDASLAPPPLASSPDATVPPASSPALPSPFATPDATAGPSAAHPDASCDAPLGPGVLAIDELMIESVAGTGDYGEWLEVQNTSGCAVDLRGLHAECAAGSRIRSLDVLDDLWLDPSGTVVIADSSDPVLDHELPGPLVTWDGQPDDVLRNLGDTVTLTAGGALVDTVTYPALKLVVGASVAFPAGCPLSRRSDWTAWQRSSASWFPGFLGTPNAPNTDVACP